MKWNSSSHSQVPEPSGGGTDWRAAPEPLPLPPPGKRDSYYQVIGENDQSRHITPRTVDGAWQFLRGLHPRFRF